MLLNPGSHVGALLARERQKAGRDLRWLAKQLNIQPKTLAAYESTRRPPQIMARFALHLLCTDPRLIAAMDRVYAHSDRAGCRKQEVLKKRHHSPKSDPDHRRCNASRGPSLREMNDGTKSE